MSSTSPDSPVSAAAAVAHGGGLRTSGPLVSFAPMTSQPRTVAPRARRSLLVEWMLAGSATMGACLVSNPFDMIKTRMQIQGELARLDPSQKLYRNPLQAFAHIARAEGVRGLQGGLGPALLFQLMMNGTRLGLYEPVKRNIALASGHPADDPHAPPIFWHNALAAAVSGATAAFVGSPFFLAKVRLQIQAKNLTIASAVASSAPAGAAASASLPPSGAAVGAQHHYTSALSGLRHVYSTEGITGLWRGASASMARITIGGTTQLMSYDAAKHLVLARTDWGDGVGVHVSASLLSGFLAAIAMNPFDVISTRLYNQPVHGGKGTLYKGWMDCARKIAVAEGPGAFGKGFWAHWLRIGPHTLLTFVLWEQFKSMATRAGH